MSFGNGSVQQQRDKRPPLIAATMAATVLALAATFIAPWEGRELKPYRDIVGVWTVCYGHTGHVEHRRYTEAECKALLRTDAGVAYSHVRRCIKNPNVNQAAALTSATFNAGPRVVCGSTLQRLANSGQWPQACAQLDRWVYAGGRKVNGLVRRRAAERRLCESPIAQR